MSPPDPALLGEVRALGHKYRAGDTGSFEAFRDLASLLLGRTIARDGSHVRLAYGPDRTSPVLGGAQGPTDPVRLRNGDYLRLSVKLFLDDTPFGRRMKVSTASFQYQLDDVGDRWVFRYDYLRDASGLHPSSHVQIRGSLLESCLPDGRSLERVHFPTHRISLEAVIRLLVDQFGLPTRDEADAWRPLLAESESEFMGIAHQSISGPEQ